MSEHRQWAFYDIDHNDYHVSLKKSTLHKIKEWNIIKWTIVYISYGLDKMKKLTQKDLFLSLLSNAERSRILNETKIIYASDALWMQISEKLLDTLIDTNYDDYEYRYNFIWWDKIHFYVNEKQHAFNEKSWFDNLFQLGLKYNKKQDEQGYLFESEYVKIY